MEYTKDEILARSGLGDRTIRKYMERGLIPRPHGHGLAATYDDEHMVRAITIARLRRAHRRLDHREVQVVQMPDELTSSAATAPRAALADIPCGPQPFGAIGAWMGPGVTRRQTSTSTMPAQ